jgi:hypothetical protein
LGIVTLPTKERDSVVAIEFSCGSNCRALCVHRRGAEASVRSGRREVALDVENVVDDGMR